MKTWIAVIQSLVLCGVLMAAHAPRAPSNQSGKAKAHVLSLKNIERADPKADFYRALRRRDFHFVGIYGYALTAPDLTEKEYLRYIPKYPVRGVEGTSDVISGKDQRRLTQIARTYAVKYNRLLLTYLRKHPQK